LWITDEADAAEAMLVLNFIFLTKNGPQRPDKVPKISHCLAMLYFLREDGIKVSTVLFIRVETPQILSMKSQFIGTGVSLAFPILFHVISIFAMSAALESHVRTGILQ
jgi:hypothetical protein